MQCKLIDLSLLAGLHVLPDISAFLLEEPVERLLVYNLCTFAQSSLLNPGAAAGKEGVSSCI